jgi:class 3 adenylate cyclase/putative methionine-R-sulfoxide reductase with GAF domain
MRRRSRAGGEPPKTRRRKTATLKRHIGPEADCQRQDLQEQLDVRTQELREALEQQMATADVLKVINRSTFDLQAVLDTLVEAAARLCHADRAGLRLQRDGFFHLVSSYGFTAEQREYMNKKPVPAKPGRGSMVGRLLMGAKVVQVKDTKADLEFTTASIVRYGFANVRTALGVPLLRGGKLIGFLILTRRVVEPFTDKQIECLTAFADQAVIAIENTRLLSELRQRTNDLTETLEQQTATSEVLGVISSSPGELQPVFKAILANAKRLCEAQFGILYLSDGDRLRFGADVGTPPKFAEFQRQRGVFRPRPGTRLEHVMLTKEVSHTADLATTAVPDMSAVLGGARSTVYVPMLKDEQIIGVICIYRQEVRPFTDKQIALVQNFAAQAIIAIENARLLNDLNKLNQQLEQRVSDQVGEIERMGRLRRFLPPQVADLIVASGTEKQLQSHRREITALFCDLRGFTGFSESSDPEDVMALLRDYHAAIGKIIIKYSGTLERYAGDGVMVVFNDPVPVENPAMQAVLMALEMRESIGTLIEKWKRLGHDLGFGIGIAHGFATLGTIGFEGRFDYAAIGTVSNVASRLCDEAKPGQILISPRVLMAVEDVVTTETVGEFTLKGIRRPMAAYNVLAPSSSKPN